MLLSEDVSLGLSSVPTMLLICTLKKQITSDGQDRVDIMPTIIYRRKTLSADLLPVTLFESWVTDGREDGHVHLELFYLGLKAFGHELRPRQVGESPAQLVQGFPHDVQFIVDGLGIQIFERTCGLNDGRGGGGVVCEKG